MNEHTVAPAKSKLTPFSPAPIRGGILQRKCACGGTPGPSGECAECQRKRLLKQAAGPIQTKLAVNKPGDPFELEADRVANMVVQMPASKPQGRTEPEKKALLQTKSAGQTSNPAVHSEAPPIVHDVLNSSGQPLGPTLRATMESRFGYDFGRVRVHTDAKAAESTRPVNALAYTVGQDIVFGAGQYAPHTIKGQKLIAHELTHTLQQRTATIPTYSSLSGPGNQFVLQRDLIGGADIGQTGPTFTGGIGSGLLSSGGAVSSTGAATPGVTFPYVSIGNFRNSGATNASENNCPLCPLPLGILAGSGKNRMELRGDLIGHVAGAQYDFKRTKERATWKLINGNWTQLTYVGPGADDDSHDQDESLTPVNNHIYVEDGPGFRDLADPIGDASATEAVYKASFREYCNVRVGSGSWKKNSNEFKWHSITWLEKVGGAWRRKAGQNEIEPGSTFVGRGSPYGLGDFPLPRGDTVPV